MLREYAIEHLQPGMMVSAVLEQNGPVKIRKVGMIRSPDMVKGLKEMGVLRVQVDVAQSIELETDELPAPTEPAPKPDTLALTPTQQLMQADRFAQVQDGQAHPPATKVAAHAAKSDRELSQHFHRSMFMPAAESLPTFWQLKGKFIASLAALVLLGGMLGFSGSVWVFHRPSHNVANAPTELLVNPQVAELASSKEAELASLKKAEQANIVELAKDNAMHNLDAKAQQDIDSGLVESNSADDEVGELASSLSDSVGATSSTDDIADDSAAALADASTNTASDNTEVQGELLNPAPPVVSAVDPALLAKFNEAVAQLEKESSATPGAQANTYEDLPRVDQLPVALLTQMPSMRFSAHMYASDSNNRWVRVNGQRAVEQDYIAEDLQIINIEPQQVVLSFKGELFTMNALTDW